MPSYKKNKYKNPTHLMDSMMYKRMDDSINITKRTSPAVFLNNLAIIVPIIVIIIMPIMVIMIYANAVQISAKVIRLSSLFQ